MTPDKDAIRSEQQRRIEAASQTVLESGLPLEQDRSAMIALARSLRGLLLQKDDPARVVHAAKAAAGVFEISLEKNPPGRPLDCKMGCTYCCSRLVGVSAPEAFLAAESILNSEDDFLRKEAFFDRAALTTGVDVSGRDKHRTPCALLADGACAIYIDRPLACRANASHSVAACLRAYEGRGSEIPAPLVHLFLGDRCRMAIYAALRSLDYPAVSYELSEAVSVVLREDNARARWCAGEDIFSGVQAPPDRSEQMDAVIDEIAEAISF